MAEGEDEVLLVVIFLDERKQIDKRQEGAGIAGVFKSGKVWGTPTELHAAGVIAIRASEEIILHVKAKGAAGGVCVCGLTEAERKGAEAEGEGEEGELHERK